MSADLLYRDLDERIAARDIKFSVMALLDRPGDPVMDVTIRWPDEDARETLRLGTIVITGVDGGRRSPSIPKTWTTASAIRRTRYSRRAAPSTRCAGETSLTRQSVFQRAKTTGQVSLSGAPCISRRHAAGLTPTIWENTRVKWL